ncbi:hypothetical protein [Embleya sp. NBC_00896]|uniref:hypothetical protein n=1 Tax=Embleya sp. NBC_00896 TaxID=2975961 RepID=UPI0038706DBB|nr:hypothetical protein OG928_00675 [Embleya sp. NBC_00896]
MRRAVVILGIVTGVLAVVVTAFAFFVDHALSADADHEQTCCWKDGATPAWTSELIGVGVPETATDRRAGYKTGSRYDVALLAFTLPEPEADAYLLPLNPKGTRMIPNLHPEAKDYRPAAGFAHLGLPEPETLLQGLREGGLCPGDVTSPHGKNVQYCVDLFAHTLETGQTRIYIRSTIEPGVTPPPSPRFVPGA